MTTTGFDKKRHNQDLLLFLPFREGAGVITQDWAKPYHKMTFGGTPTWTNLDNDMTVLDFGNLDEIACTGADSADLDFTSEDFSLAAWAKHDDISGAHVIFNRGQLNACGWEWYTASGNLALRTNQAASREGASGIGCVTTGTWQFFVATRSGLVAQMYKDAETVAMLHTANGLIDPVACGVQTFRVANNPNSNYFDGMLAWVRVWKRKLSLPEIRSMLEAERGLFGV